MILKLFRKVKEDAHVRSFKDRRVKVFRVVAEYLGLDGKFYRKSFEKRGGWPFILSEGTNEELNTKQYQW